jgi:hypothetical protein
MILKPAGDVTIFEVGALYEELKQAVTAILKLNWTFPKWTNSMPQRFNCCLPSVGRNVLC